MGLTRIRAEQISDIDYKQAVRVITLSNITLSGGAPSTVDNVNLNAGDRILVAGQSTGSQNGLYQVSTVGAGNNGTWTRSTDGNETGEIEAGMIVMVTEGDVYKDTQWKLTTNNPIVVGTTALVFEQNSAFAFGNVYANGTAVLATSVGDALTLTAGDNIAITGNNTSKTVTIGVTGISLNSISNGTSNVNVVSSGGNVTVGIGGTSNVAVFNTGGVDIKGNVGIDGANADVGSVSTTAGWYYENSFSVSSQDTEPRGVFFKSDGTRMYVCGNAGDDIIQYDLGTAWDVSTAVYNNAYVVSSQSSTAYDVSLSADGTKMWVLDGGNDAVDQYTLASAWDVGSATYDSVTFSVTSQESAPLGFWFKPDGTKMYVTGSTGDDVNEYNLSSAGNVGTATFSQVSSSLSAYETGPEGLAFSSDGTKMWIVGSTYNRITEFTLSTPWDVSTLSFASWVPVATSGPYLLLGASGLYVNTAVGVAYVSDYQNDRIFQYATDTPTGQLYGPQWTTETDFVVGNNLAINANVWAGGSAHRFLGTVTAVSSFSAPSFATTTSTGTTSLITGTTTGTLNFATGITTGTLNQMTAQTTGPFVLGGTAATGPINIGRSTANQSIVIGNGVTGSGNVKTIDIGTLGASGSNTNVTIGSSTSGAFTTTTIYGNTSAGNLTTTGLISGTGNVTGGNLVTTGQANIASLVISGNVTGNLLPSANITYNLGSNTQRWNDIWLANSTIYLGNAQISANSTAITFTNPAGGTTVLSGATPEVSATTVSATGNITGGNLTTAGQVTATGNVTGGNIRTTGQVSATGNITGGNLSGTSITGTLATAAQPNITSVGTLSSLSVSGNVTGGNITTAGSLTTGPQFVTGNIDVTGNVNVTGNLNYANVTDLVVGDPLIYIGANNSGDVYDLGIVAAWDDGLYQHGGLVRDASDGVWKLFGNVVEEPTTVVDFTNAVYQPFLSGAISSTSSISATGNVTGGNLLTGGLISATANITGGNLITTGQVSATANITGGNLKTSAVTIGSTGAVSGVTTISASGNANVGNLGAATVVATTLTGTLSTAAQTNITSVGTLTSLAVTGNVTGGNLLTGGLISATGNITGGNILGNGAGLSGINVFSNITVSGGNSAVASGISDTLTLTAGDGITLVADAGNSVITIAQSSSGDSIFATGGDMGTVTEAVTASEDLGLVTEVPAATEIDMGTIVTSGVLYPDSLVLPTKTVAQLANLSATPAGQFVFCSNESGGSVPAFSDGTNWRRVTDRAIVT